MSNNYMQAGNSVSFTFTEKGKKVHLLDDTLLFPSKTLCGVYTDGVNYPIEKQIKHPDFCKKCQNSYKKMIPTKSGTILTRDSNPKNLTTVTSN